MHHRAVRPDDPFLHSALLCCEVDRVHIEWLPIDGRVHVPIESDDALLGDRHIRREQITGVRIHAGRQQ